MRNAALRSQPRVCNSAQIRIQRGEDLIECAALALGGKLQELSQRGIDGRHNLILLFFCGRLVPELDLPLSNFRQPAVGALTKMHGYMVCALAIYIWIGAPCVA